MLENGLQKFILRSFESLQENQGNLRILTTQNFDLILHWKTTKKLKKYLDNKTRTSNKFHLYHDLTFQEVKF